MYREKNKSSPYALSFSAFLICLLFFYAWPLLTNTLFSLGYEGILSQLWLYRKEALYNSILIQKENTPLSLLTILESDPLIGKESDIGELHADLLSTQSGSMDEIMSLYTQSITPESRTRIMTKLSYLSWALDLPKDRVPVSSGSTEERRVEYSSWELQDRESAEARIQEAAKNRVQYLNILPPKDQSSILRDTIDFLDTDKERVDW